MTLYKEYIPWRGKELKFYISYWKGKGYRVTALPVKRITEGDFQIESSEAISGFNDTLLEVNRQSSKRLDEAIKILAERKSKYLQWFEEKYPKGE